MRPTLVLPLTVVLLAGGSAARAAEPGTGTSTGAMSEDLRDQLKRELKEELKDEIKAELAAEGAATGAVQEDTWAEEEWKWEEPVKPELNFLELDGYFRFRYELFKDLDLKTYYNPGGNTTAFGPFSPGYAPPVSICNTDPRCAAGRLGDSHGNTGSTLAGANMRLRMEPIFNVYEDIKIKMQVDLLDNVVLGSTPEGFPLSDALPLIAFSQTQLPPSDGRNALADSIRVKRVWAEVMTPLGQLRVGRMPSHFGMGVLANEGRGIDSDFGDTNDRLLFATKIAGHYIVPAYDWAVSGPTSAQVGSPTGQPFDRDQVDDVDQFILAIAKSDKDQEIKEKLENDETVVNYGTYQVYRVQAYDAADYYKAGQPEDQAGARDLVVRDAEAWIYSVWFKLIFRKLLLEMEYVGVIGKIGNDVQTGLFDSRGGGIALAMHGGAARLEYKLLHDSLTLHLLFAAASGDNAPGWGVRPLTDATPRPGSWDGAQQNDGRINNFKFDPDFRVDLIFWRNLVGTLTDAMVIRPGIQYNLTEGFGGRLDIVYSRAWYAESTPSAGTGDPMKDLGVEADARIFYSSDDGFHAWLEYGLFVPFGSLNTRILRPETGAPDTLEPGVAQTLRAVLAVTY